MKKQYRVYLDIMAEDLDEAVKIADEKAQDGISYRENSTITNVFNVVPYPFNREEELVMCEATRIALTSYNTFYIIAHEGDITNEDLIGLRNKITEYMS